MPRVLITGAAGFIGMHCSIRFLKEGWDVVGLDNLNDYYSVKLKLDRLAEVEKHSSSANFLMFTEDLDSDVWDKLVDFTFDAVVHLAAQAGVRYSLENPNAYITSNIIGFQRVLEFVDKRKIDKLFYASSSSVYGKSSEIPFTETQKCNSPESYYAATKKSNELMAFAYDKTKKVKSVGMRFFTVYGPFGRPDMAPYIFAKSALNDLEISIFNHGNQSRDFTYIDDIVESIYRLVGLKSSSYETMVVNIGQGSPVNLMEFIGVIENVSGRDLRKRFIDAQLGDVANTYANTERLRKLTDFSPEVNITDGVGKFWQWFNEYHN